MSSPYDKLGTILRFNSAIVYEKKYANEVATPMRCAVAIVGSTMPKSIVMAPEVDRRAAGFRLAGKVSDWRALVGDLAQARNNETLRPHLDTITRDLYWRLHAAGKGANWRAIALGEFGAVPVAELDFEHDVDTRDEAIRRLYLLYRRAAATEFYAGTKHREWLDLKPGTPAYELLEVLVDTGDKVRFRQEADDLRRVDLTPILGFGTPVLRLHIAARSARYLAKFVPIGRRGTATPRETWPEVRPEAESD